MNNKKLGIFIFRRDLRLDDNHGLINLAKNVDIILPVFFLDSYQIIKSEHNKYYFSNNAVQFMCESLIDLNNQLNKKKSSLRLFFGNPSELLEKIIDNINNNYKEIIVGWNTDFSEYSKIRDNKMIKICNRFNINTCITDSDYSLRPLQEYLNKNGNAYKQFGAFYKNAIKNSPLSPIKYTKNNFISHNIKFKHEFDKSLNTFYQNNENIAQHGGRNEALKKIYHIDKFKDYNKFRDILSYNTTNLSAALNFGCISIREVYYSKLSRNNIILKQLYWRDFYLQATKYLPFASSYHRHMDERYDNIKWKNNKNDWEKLWNSKTGFLLIDAGMNEMKISGFLHNRARMLLGVFWTKYLLINTLHPKYGSQVGYSRLLVDAIGASQNKLNHAWIDEFDFPGKKYSAPGAPLSGRPMDISNKMINKWDPDCSYIKKWLPHLKNIPNNELIKWNDDIAKKYNYIHPGPIFDSKKKYQEWINLCKIKH